MNRASTPTLDDLLAVREACFRVRHFVQHREQATGLVAGNPYGGLWLDDLVRLLASTEDLLGRYGVSAD